MTSQREIVVSYVNSKCPQKCYHCYINSDSLPNISSDEPFIFELMDTTLPLKEPFRRATFEIYPDIMLLTDPVKYYGELVSHGLEYDKSIATIGRTKDRKSKLEELKKLGLKRVITSFLGHGKTHNSAVRLNNSYQTLLETVEDAQTLGLDLLVQYFVDKRSISDTGSFEKDVGEFGISRDGILYKIPNYTGSAMDNERLRIDKDDLSSHFGEDIPKTLTRSNKPEQEYASLILNGELNERFKRIFEVFLTHPEIPLVVLPDRSVYGSFDLKNPIGKLSQKSLVDCAVKADRELDSKKVNLVELVSKCSDKQNQKLYSPPALISKWLDLYFRSLKDSSN